MSRQYYVYIVTNKRNTVLYTGVTNNLARRIDAHKNKIFKSFTKKYNADKLVYAEACDNIGSAIAREKQIKGGSRQKKLDLIKSVNPDFEELFC
jgi:putative endonuclease